MTSWEPTPYPALNPIIQWWDSTFTIGYEDDHWLGKYTPELPFGAVAAYLVMVWGLPKILANQPDRKNELKWVFVLWNLFLSVMSLCIVVGVGAPWISDIYRKGFWYVYCDYEHYYSYGRKSLLYWAYIFALSKYAELLDTFFLIVRSPRSPLMFLHWYHHCTVLLFTWFAEYWRFSIGFIFIVVNASVHTVMYFYFAVRGMGIHVPKNVAMGITLFQISQMWIGLAANGYWIYSYLNGNTSCSCDAPHVMMWSCILMYGSYLFLFCKLFAERYLWNKPFPGKESWEANKKKQAPKKSKAKKLD